MDYALTCVLAFLLAVVHEAGIVVYSRSIFEEHATIGVLMTALLTGTANLGILIFVNQNTLIVPIVIGACLGYLVGRRLPLGKSRKDGPRRRSRCRNCDPSDDDG